MADAMDLADLIYREVKTLPDSLAREVLDFAAFLRERTERAEWRDLIAAQERSLRSIWDNPEDDVWNDA